MSCHDNKHCKDGVKLSQFQPLKRVSANTKVVLTEDQFATIETIAKYIAPQAQSLDAFADNEILMVADGGFALSGLKYDPVIDAIVYDGKIIADEVETSNDTFQISERIALASFGTQLSINSIFDDTKSLPLFTKYDETGTLGNFQQVIGPEITIPIETDDFFTFTGASYIPPTTTATTNTNTNRGRYRFADDGKNVRISTTATNLEGRELIVFGTESNPYVEFVTKAYNGTPESETVVEYSGAIASEPGFVYATMIETFDPVTKEPSGVPLNMLGSDANGFFSGYLVVVAQTRGEVQLAGGGNVNSSGTALDAQIMVANGPDPSNIRSSGVTLAELPPGINDLYPEFVTSDETLTLDQRLIICQPAFSSNDITLTLPEVNSAFAAKYFLEVYNASINTAYDVMINDSLGAQVLSVKPQDRVLVFAVGSSWDFIILSSQFFSDNSITGVGSFSDPAKVAIDGVIESAARVFVSPSQKSVIDNQSNINTGDETTATIQAKRPLKTINNESIEGVGNIAWPLLYGHIGVTNSSPFVTTSNVAQLADTWNLTLPDTDTYDVIVTVEWNLDDTGIDAIFRFDVNGLTGIETEQEPKDSSNRIFFTTFALTPLQAGSNTIELFVRKSVSNGDDLTIFSNRYTARKIDVLS